MNRLRKTTLLLMLAGIFILCAAVTAQAYVSVNLGTDGTGIRSSTDGSTVVQGYWTGTNGFKITWNITLSDEYEYNYTITNLAGTGFVDPRVQALAIAVSPDFKLIEGSETSPASYTIGAVTVGGISFDNAIYWTGLNAGAPIAFHFDSPNAPVWGSFSAADSSYGTPVPTAHNGDAAISIFMPDGQTNFEDYIPVPDTARVPVPPSILLLGSGLLGLVSFRGKFLK
jgi:hypothetical protein